MIVYVNGDSYSCESDGKRYSEFLGETYNCDVINRSIGGSCNSRIIRSSLRELINLKKTHTNILAVIGLSFIFRSEVWNTIDQLERFKNQDDGEFTSYQFAHGNNWFQNKAVSSTTPSHLKDYAKQWLTYYNPEAEITNLFANIIGLHAWCMQNQIRLLIFSGPGMEKIELSSPFIKPFNDYISNSANFIDLFNFSFCKYCTSSGFVAPDHDVLGDLGHHGQKAHRHFSNYLVEYIQHYEI